MSKTCTFALRGFLATPRISSRWPAAPAPSCAGSVHVLATAAAAVGDVANIAALHHAGRILTPADVSRTAAHAGQAEVVWIALDLG
jgi:hypothetical protein